MLAMGRERTVIAGSETNDGEVGELNGESHILIVWLGKGFLLWAIGWKAETS